MRIGFDISQTGKLKAGCGYFADNLIRNLAEFDRQNEYFLLPTWGDHFWDPEWETATVRLQRPNFHRMPGHKSLPEAQLFWNQPVGSGAQFAELDLIHSNNFFCPPALPKTRLVYTLYDLSFLFHPEWTPEENRIGCFDGVFNASIYADLILSISHFSRKQFLEVFSHYPAERVVVVYPGSRFLEPRDTPGPKIWNGFRPRSIG